MYVCGITPYDATHLGHALTYVNFDLVQRALLDAGLEVSYVQNVTDVDEPLLERAERDGVDWRDLALAETERFREDMTALRVIAPQAYIGAVEAIPLIIPVIEKLLADGNAYLLDGDIYFAVDTAARFGSVAGLTREQMLALFAERGGDPDRPGKRDPLDPVLWRGERPGEPSWEAPFGPAGRAGTSSARRSRSNTSAARSTFKAAAATWPTPITSAARPTPSPSPGVRRSPTATCIPGCSRSRAPRCPSRWATWSSSPCCAATASTRWRSGSRCFSTTTARTGSGPPRCSTGGIATFEHWRAAVALKGGPDGANVLARMRACLADDLDAPGAVAAVHAWANGAFAGDTSDPESPALVRAAVDALLGIEL